MRRMLGELLIPLAIAYGAVLVLVYLFQSHLVFFPGTGREAVVTPQSYGLRFESVQIRFPSQRPGRMNVPRVEADVVRLAQLGCLDFHPWPVRAEDTDHPDELPSLVGSLRQRAGWRNVTAVSLSAAFASALMTTSSPPRRTPTGRPHGPARGG